MTSLPRRAALLAVVLLGVLLMVPGAMHAAYHCDEVNVFRHVTDFAAGRLANPGRPGLLWAALIPTIHLGDAVASIHALRATAVAASAATLALVGLLATYGRRDDGTWSILASGGLLATSLGWHTHAFEVRTDTYTAPLTLGAAALLLRERVSNRAAVGAGVCMAAAGLTSQKSIYNAAALALGWVVFQIAAKADLRRAAVTAGIAVGTALALVVAWYAGLTLASGSESFVASNLDTAVRTGFSEVWSLERNAKTLGATVQRAPALWGLAPIALGVALVRARRRPAALAMGVVAAAMVATIFVHRGFRPYFIASFEPYLAVLSGGLLGSICWDLRRRLSGLGAGAVALASVPLLAIGVGTAHHNRDGAAALLATDNAHQLRVVTEVTAAFPEPVPYWDAIGLVPGYEETTFFGTGPTRAAKRAKMPGNMFVKLARAEKPRFFIRDYMTRDLYFRPDELRWLWRQYPPYRPNLHLLGGRIRVSPEGAAGRLEVLVDGDYTVRFLGGWTGEALLDDAPVQDGDVVTLREGTVELRGRADRGDGDLAFFIGRDREPEDVRVDWSMYPRLRRDRFQHYDRRGKEADLLTPRQDPTMTDKKHKARTRRHLQARARARERLAQP